MDARQVFASFQQSNTVTPQIDAAISVPLVRRELYKLLVDQPAQPFAALIRAAFRKEREFREALWERTVEDEVDFYEGIYSCAFLLYRLGSVTDLEYLWSTKHINMDVGSCLGAEFFTGAGFDASLEFLQQGQILAADEIADYLKKWQQYGWCPEEQKSWEADMAADIRNG